MKSALLTAFVLFVSCNAFGQSCVDTAKEVTPVLSNETRAFYEQNLAAAEAVHLDKPNEADSIIWLGRRTAYLGRYRDAVWIYSSGLKLFPNDARLYRHRGHRFITIRCFDDAIRDFEKAAELVRGKPDEIEPDGIPNAKNIPTSSLQSNIWYHLGLAYYLKGDYKRAAKAYEECEKVSKNPDMLVATKHWQYMTLRRLGKKDEAADAIKAIPNDLVLIENDDYYKLIKVYNGTASGDSLLKDFSAAPDSVSKASVGYGLGSRYLSDNKKDDAKKIFLAIVMGKQWASFGYIAAEVELNSGGKPDPGVRRNSGFRSAPININH